MVIASIGAFIGLILFGSIGQNVGLLFACLFAIHFFNFGMIVLTVGPIATETVPLGLITTASGMVIAAGELLGGGLAPIIGGQVAEKFGIDHILWLPIITMAVGILISFGLVETHHKKQL